jgi:MFS family permease
VSPRLATTGVFFTHGAIVGSWVANIPWVQERFGLSKTEMGLMILGLSAGVVASMLLSGQAVVRHGTRRVTTVMILVASVLVVLPILAPHPLLVALGLLLLGGALGSADVGVNAHGVGVEQRLERPIMSSLHAGWAFGGLAGAGLAAAGAAAGLDPGSRSSSPPS